MSEISVIEFKSAIDFVPLVEASRRLSEQFKLTAARLAGEPAIVATDQRGMTRVHLRGPVAPGIVQMNDEIGRAIHRRLDEQFLYGSRGAGVDLVVYDEVSG